MPDATGPLRTALQNLRTDLTSVRGVIGRLPQLIALVMLCAMLAMVFHKLHADITLIIEQNPDDRTRAILRYLISNSAEEPPVTPDN